MIWVIGGTSETRRLLNRLSGIKGFIVTVATYSGAEVLDGYQPIVGRMDYNGMIKFIKDKSIDIVVDMSHPYATEVTRNAKSACAASDTQYIRFVRRGSELEDCITVGSVEQCASYLQDIKGCIFFTTGIKSISDFERIRGENRFIYRVLPSVFSIQECVSQGVRMEDIVAILGPVSEELNYQMFKDYKADYVVMKDSGKEGGTLEKINAAKRLGITPLVILRQCAEEGPESIEDILRILI